MLAGGGAAHGCCGQQRRRGAEWRAAERPGCRIAEDAGSSACSASNAFSNQQSAATRSRAYRSSVRLSGRGAAVAAADTCHDGGGPSTWLPPCSRQPTRASAAATCIQWRWSRAWKKCRGAFDAAASGGDVGKRRQAVVGGRHTTTAGAHQQPPPRRRHAALDAGLAVGRHSAQRRSRGAAIELQAPQFPLASCGAVGEER